MSRAHLVNRSSRWLWLPVLGALFAAAAPACIIVDDDDDGYYYEDPPPPDPAIYEVSIDEGAQLDADPGAGVGVFVEYQGAGSWRVWTTCDTEVTEVSCNFDLFLEGYGLEASASEDLEGSDELEERGDLLRVSLSTSTDTDGVIVQLDEGSALRVEVWLDGALDGRFVSWVSGGEVQNPPPSNPVDFVP
jgi:hypothetical protein